MSLACTALAPMPHSPLATSSMVTHVTGRIDSSSMLTIAPSDARDLQLIAEDLGRRLGADAVEPARRRSHAMRDDMVVDAVLGAITAAVASDAGGPPPIGMSPT